MEAGRATLGVEMADSTVAMEVLLSGGGGEGCRAAWTSPRAGGATMWPLPNRLCCVLACGADPLASEVGVPPCRHPRVSAQILASSIVLNLQMRAAKLPQNTPELVYAASLHGRGRGGCRDSYHGGAVVSSRREARLWRGGRGGL